MKNDFIQYDFRRDPRFDQLRDRILIRWSGRPINWERWLPDNDKEIIEVAGPNELFAIAHNIAAALGKGLASTDLLEDTESLYFSEGAKRYRQHLDRERSTILVNEAKRRVMEREGRLACEICEFDFFDVYGSLGEGFIEAHHTIPVSAMKEGDLTNIDDIALLCSNCHRMVHRRIPWIQRHEFRNLLHGGRS